MHAILRGERWARVLALLVICLFPLLSPYSAKADKLVLKGGGTLRGVVISKDKDSFMVQTESSVRPLKLARSKVEEIVREKSAIDEYLELKKSTPETASSMFDFGQWCDEHKLKSLGKHYYECAVELDKEFEPAHKKLGHIKYEEQWLTQDQYKEAQGLVKVKGKWVSPEEKAKQQAAAALSAEQESWKKRIRILYQAYNYGTAAKRRDAELQLLAIQDAAAVPGIVQVLGSEPSPAVRLMMSRILGAIKGSEAGLALANAVMVDTDKTVCDALVGELKLHQEPKTMALFFKALKAENPIFVNRSAWVLGELGNLSAVPKLVPVLITSREKIVAETTTVDNGGVGFGSIAPGAPGAGGASRAGGVGVGGASAMNMSGVPYGVVPQAVVGPGVVAYGAAPLGAYGAGANSMIPPPRSTSYRFEREVFYNVEVLNALKKMTGQDFQFDGVAWKNWITAKFQADKKPSRKAPEP